MALFPSGGAAVKGRVLASFPSTVGGTGGISVSKSNGIWTIEPAWDDLSVETTLADASARQLWIYNPSTDVYTRLSVQYLLDNLPEGPAGHTGATGATGAQGASVGVKFTYSTTTTDSDPGSGVFRFNNATIASVTAAYIDNNEAGGSSVSAWLDTFDDSTTTAKGTLVIRGVTTQSAWAVFAVTGSVVDGTGYRKLTLTHVASGGVWTNGETFAFGFERTGDKGSDGLGSGDVTAAAANTADNRVVRTDGSSGKGIQESVINLDDTTGTMYPQTNDSGALGKAAQSWADLFLASGGVINWGNGAVTITHNGGLHAIVVAGGNLGTEGVYPTTNDVGSLGGPSNSYADLYLASGAVINYANGNFTITHASGTLTMSGTLSIGTSNAFTCGSVELGHASDTTLSRSAAGELAVEGIVVKKVGKETIWVPAGAMTANTTNGAASGTAEMSSNKNMFKTLDYDATTQEFAQFEIFFPKSWNLGTVTFIPVWSHASTTTNFGVVWAVCGVARSDDDAGDVAFGTAQTSTDTGGTTNDIYIGPESSAITIAGTPAAGDTVQFRVQRNPSDGSDTMAIDARLHGVKILFTTSASTDA